MKKYLMLSLFLSSVLLCSAQSGDSGGLKVLIVNRGGKIIKNPNVFFSVNASPETIPADKRGVTTLAGVFPGDTLTIVTSSKTYSFIVPALDSVAVRLNNRMSYRMKADGNVYHDMGYFIVSANENTSAVNKLDMRDKSGYLDLVSYLSGRVAGVQVVRFGAETQVVIRGISTLNGEIGAAVVLDGVMQDSFDAVNRSVNLKDIQSVEILKDGSLYGVRGANGVIVVTTFQQQSK